MRNVLARLVLSDRYAAARRRLVEWRRAVTRAPHVVSVFLELDDPYSYLLANYLDELGRHYAIELRLYVVEALRGAYRPEPALYHEYALGDCRQFAGELGVPFLDKGATPPVEHRRALLDLLAARESSDTFAADLREGITAYWRGDTEALARRCRGVSGGPAAKAMLDRNRALLVRLGHYEAATLYYAGEWYRGVERLHYLVSRLDRHGLHREPGLAPRIASIRQVMQPPLPVSPPAAARSLPPLEMFYSVRSPYCWLALARTVAIADAFGVELHFRPLLPMVMRGLPLPWRKARYCLLDAKRESRRHEVPFGRMADPLGAGVERLMAVWQYAIAEHRERDFLASAGEAVWSRGVDVRTNRGLRKVTAKAGLFWPGVAAALADESWRAVAAANAESLQESGLWGVPGFRIGEWVAWGQDRDWLVARRLEELCDSGEGILV